MDNGSTISITDLPSSEETVAARRRRNARLRAEKWRSRQRKGVGVYPIELSDSEITVLFDAGLANESSGDDPAEISRAISRLIQNIRRKT